MVIREDKVYSSQRQKLEGPQNPVWSEAALVLTWREGCGEQASTHLGASVHKEDSGVLLPWLHGMRLVDHAIELHIRPRVEVKDFRGHVIRGAAYRQTSHGYSDRSPEPADTHTPLPGPHPLRVSWKHPILCFSKVF